MEGSIVIGIVGSGQLGRILIEHGIRKLPTYKTSLIRVLSPTAECSVAALKDPNVQIVLGDYHDVVSLRQFANGCSVITYEIEHVNADALDRVGNDYQVKICPSPGALKIIQDKGLQKLHYVKHGIPVVDFVLSENPKIDFWDTDAQFSVQAKSNYPVVFKSRLGGYDGKGVDVITSGQQSSHLSRNVLIERYMENMREVAVIVARDYQAVYCYPPTLMTFHDFEHTLDTCETPSSIDSFTLERCQAIAAQAAISFDSIGVFAVEMFVTHDGRILVNEIAPRVHNSGHHTIHTTNVSQFEMLARILVGYPIEQPIELCPQYVMRNLYPSQGFAAAATANTRYAIVNHLAVFDPIKGPFFVDYGKPSLGRWRKMGHITHIGKTHKHVHEEMHWHRRNLVIEYVAKEDSRDEKQTNSIGIVMGSESDWPVMQEACAMLQELHLGYEVTVVSAHRTPDRLCVYAKTAQSRGIRVIIAGAGGAAHLPGMLAANTVIPVIGVPIKTAALNGVDSLYSIVQMPSGVPVACMAINGARNAALFAAQILGQCEAVAEYRDQIERTVMESACFRTKKINE